MIDLDKGFDYSLPEDTIGDEPEEATAPVTRRTPRLAKTPIRDLFSQTRNGELDWKAWPPPPKAGGRREFPLDPETCRFVIESGDGERMTILEPERVAFRVGQNEVNASGPFVRELNALVRSAYPVR